MRRWPNMIGTRRSSTTSWLHRHDGGVFASCRLRLGADARVRSLMTCEGWRGVRRSPLRLWFVFCDFPDRNPATPAFFER